MTHSMSSSIPVAKEVTSQGWNRNSVPPLWYPGAINLRHQLRGLRICHMTLDQIIVLRLVHLNTWREEINNSMHHPSCWRGFLCQFWNTQEKEEGHVYWRPPFACANWSNRPPQSLPHNLSGVYGVGYIAHCTTPKNRTMRIQFIW